MNDDKKPPQPDPSRSSVENADDNPWDEHDGGGRTIATAGPSFEMPSGIPSPITVPPSDMESDIDAEAFDVEAFDAEPIDLEPRAVDPKTALTKKNAKATMMGFGPPRPPPANTVDSLPTEPTAFVPMHAFAIDGSTVEASPASPGPSAAAPAPPAAPSPPRPRRAPPPRPQERGAAPLPRPGGPPSSRRIPDDGPSAASARMAVMPVSQLGKKDEASGLAAAAAISLAAASSHTTSSAGADKGAPESKQAERDAMTAAHHGSDLRLSFSGHEVDEATRAVSPKEILRHRDAQVIVGDDALGDEATLAVVPGSLEALGIGPGLMQAFHAREQAQSRQNAHQEPPFPPPSQPNVPSSPGRSSGHFQPAHLQQQHEGMRSRAQSQPWADPYAHGPPSSHHGFDPMPPQSAPGMPAQVPGGYAQSGRQPTAQPTFPLGGYSAFTPASGPSSQGNYAPSMPHYGQPGQGGPAGQGGQSEPWHAQGSPSAPEMSGPYTFTSQAILLVVVGSVCLAIFVIGVVLFVTTKF